MGIKTKFNPEKIRAFFQMIFIIPACAGFYTALALGLPMQFISLEVIQWRIIGVLLFISLNITGFYAACVYFKKHGNFDL